MLVTISFAFPNVEKLRCWLNYFPISLALLVLASPPHVVQVPRHQFYGDSCTEFVPTPEDPHAAAAMDGGGGAIFLFVQSFFIIFCCSSLKPGQFFVFPFIASSSSSSSFFFFFFFLGMGGTRVWSGGVWA